MEGRNSVSFSVLPDEELVGAAVTDIEALSELVKRYLPVVHYLSGQFPGAARDDLAQEGAMALIKAVRSYSPDKGTKFATYASRCIENEVLMHLRSIKKLGAEVYLEDTIGKDKDDNTVSLQEVIENDEKSIEDVVDLKFKIKRLYDKMKEVLIEREKIIIEMRFRIRWKKT